MAKNSTGSGQNYKLTATGIFSAVFGLSLLTLILCENDPNRSTTFLISITGCLFGWVTAFVTSPYDKNDGDKINRFTKLIGTFLSGYILAKLDKVVENYFSVTNIETVLSNIAGLRILFFICFFLLTWVVVFVYRLYATGDTPDVRQIKNQGHTS
jgi:hypothetical protein